VQYFAQQLRSIASYEKREQVQQANVSKHRTLTFHFSIVIQIHLNIYPITRQSHHMRESTAAIVALFGKTTSDQIIPHQ